MSAPTIAVPVAYPYRLAFRHLGRGRFGDLLTASLRIMLVTGDYTPGATDEWATTPAAAETHGTGYTPGGPLLTGLGFDDVPELGRSALTCDPVTFPAAGFVFRRAVIYADTGDPGSSPLLSYVDFGADVSPAGTDLTLTFATSVFRIGPATLPG